MHTQQQSALIIILFEKGCGKNAILVLTTGWKHRTAGTCEDEWVRNTRKEQLLFCCTEGLEQTVKELHDVQLLKKVVQNKQEVIRQQCSLLPYSKGYNLSLSFSHAPVMHMDKSAIRTQKDLFI